MTDETTNTITKKPLDEITAFLRRFIIFTNESHADILALWILHTWAFDAAYSTPYIYVHSPEPQSGKTRVLEVCALLARNGISSSTISTAGLFRLIEDRQPTVFLDEVDTVFTGAANEELRGVLNSGYKQGGSAMRFDGREVVTFNTYCPKMLVGIDNGVMPDTLRDRCIPIYLKRKRPDQEVERYMPRKVEPDAEALKLRIRAWVDHNFERIMTAPDPAAIDGISDRSFEIAEPLLILARVCGVEARIRKAIYALMSSKTPVLSLGVQVLSAARELFEEAKADRLSSAQIAAHTGVSPKRLGTLLAKYDIRPTTILFATGEKLKGYFRRDFQDAWERYL